MELYMFDPLAAMVLLISVYTLTVLEVYLVPNLNCDCSLCKLLNAFIPLYAKLQDIVQLVFKEAAKSDVVWPFFGMVAQSKQAAVCFLSKVLQVGVTTCFKRLNVRILACVSD